MQYCLFGHECRFLFFSEWLLYLSLKGSHIFHKLRPVDQLRHLLVTCAGGESEEVERFFKLHRVRIQNQVFDYISKMSIAVFCDFERFQRAYERPFAQMCLLRTNTDVTHNPNYGFAILM